MFPDIKPPEQLGFELLAQEMIDDCSDLEDLDQLDPKEFKDDESDDDDRDMYKILDDKGLLGSLEEEKQEKGHGGLGEEKQEKGHGGLGEEKQKKEKLLKTKTLIRIKNFLVIFS